VARRRLDAELVRRGLVTSRAEAEEVVRAGLVTVGGAPASTPAALVEPAEAVRVVAASRDFVSRGGEKLRAALDRFAIDPLGASCLDAGASTGGFTDCLLRAGANRVVAVDVGYGQLAWSLRGDPRVTVLERTNVRDLAVADLPFAAGIVVADLSFVSLRSIVPALARISEDDASFVLLVKPQFEADPRAVGVGGVVRDPAVWREAVLTVAEACRAAGVGPVDVMASPITGPAGNVEFLLHAEKAATGTTRPALDVDGAIADGQVVAR
jgi:23S rRNA (cytidine1920-2'-O)/16S rRNA (cytidine1409-2'-O)-methyltransferase